MNSLLVLCLLCTVALPVKGSPCHDNRHINGCSIPAFLPNWYKETFTPACNKHDLCYSCASIYKRDRISCDDEFKSNMVASCDGGWFCGKAASVYHWVVRKFGRLHFSNESPDWCQRQWVQNCTDLYR